MPTYEYRCQTCDRRVEGVGPQDILICGDDDEVMVRVYTFSTVGMPTRAGARMGRGLRNRSRQLKETQNDGPPQPPS
jgi:predicted nucleic acid-binding Zn ribbon protein